MLPALGIALVVVLMEFWFADFANFYDRMVPSINAKQAQYRRLLSGDLEADTAFVGSSTVMFGIDPEIIDAKTGWQSFNAGQLGYAPANLSAALIEEIVASGHVNRIVYGMDGWALSLPVGNRHLVDAAHRGDHFLWNWALFRNRKMFFFWVGELLEGRLLPPSTAWYRNMVAEGRILELDGLQLSDRGHLAVASRLNPSWPSYIPPGGGTYRQEQFTAFDNAVSAAQEAGVEFVLVRMPEYQRTYDEHSAEHATLTAFLAGYANAKSIRFIDFSKSGAFPHSDNSLFFDIHHVNDVGSVLFSERLGEQLASPQAPQTPRPND